MQDSTETSHTKTLPTDMPIIKTGSLGPTVISSCYEDGYHDIDPPNVCKWMTAAGISMCLTCGRHE